mmetsp:Transcript_3731/g.12073  ORF Transcript_3731/g.12073 Transcript_3731/m.12073 type:complete len:371 (+) Transcript_3731:686-1798(+)
MGLVYGADATRWMAQPDAAFCRPALEADRAMPRATVATGEASVPGLLSLPVAGSTHTSSDASHTGVQSYCARSPILSCSWDHLTSNTPPVPSVAICSRSCRPLDASRPTSSATPTLTTLLFGTALSAAASSATEQKSNSTFSRASRTFRLARPFLVLYLMVFVSIVSEGQVQSIAKPARDASQVRGVRSSRQVLKGASQLWVQRSHTAVEHTVCVAGCTCSRSCKVFPQILSSVDDSPSRDRTVGRPSVTTKVTALTPSRRKSLSRTSRARLSPHAVDVRNCGPPVKKELTRPSRAARSVQKYESDTRLSCVSTHAIHEKPTMATRAFDPSGRIGSACSTPLTKSRICACSCTPFDARASIDPDLSSTNT